MLHLIKILTIFIILSYTDSFQFAMPIRIYDSDLSIIFLPQSRRDSAVSPVESSNGPEQASQTVPYDNVIKARNNLLDILRDFAKNSSTGVFLTDLSSVNRLQKSVAELEALAGAPSENFPGLMLGDWTLVCTTNAPP